MLDKKQKIDISANILNDELGNIYIANKDFSRARTLEQFVQCSGGEKLYEDANNGWKYLLGSKKGTKLTLTFPVGCKTVADLYELQDRYKKSAQEKQTSDDILNF